MKPFRTSATHFAWHQHLLLGLIVFTGAITLLGSALVSRAAAQEAWSGYLVIKASYRYNTPGAVSRGNTKSAFYFDGTPESVLSDTGPGGTSRIWEQRVRWSGYIRESQVVAPTCAGHTNYRASGSGVGIAQIALFEQPDVFPLPAGAYTLDGGYDRQMQGRRVSIGGCPFAVDVAQPQHPACTGGLGVGGLWQRADNGVNTLALAGSHSIVNQGTASRGTELHCRSDFHNGTATWVVTRGAIRPQCSNGRDDDADGRTDHSAGIPLYRDPGCESDADGSEA
jgi:hypothetical protein